MNLISQNIFGNPLLEWLIGLGIAIAAAAVLLLAKRIVARHFLKLAQRTRTDLDDMLAGLVGKISPLFLLLAGLYAGSFRLEFAPETHQVIHRVLFAALLIQGALLGNNIIAYLISKTTRLPEYEDAAARTMLNAVGFLSKLVLLSVILLVLLDNLGFDITTLIASLGIGGIAVALAAQNILGDLFASLSIAIDKPFVIGDFIVVDSYLGTIETIGMRTTRIRSLSGELIVFSNTDLLRSRVRNYKRMTERRVLFSLDVVYGTPYSKVEAIPGMVRDIIEAEGLTRFDRAHFKEYGPSALTFEFVYYVLAPDYNTYMDVQQRINLAIYRRFEEEGIDFAFPTHTVHLQQTASERNPSTQSTRHE